MAGQQILQIRQGIHVLPGGQGQETHLLCLEAHPGLPKNLIGWHILPVQQAGLKGSSCAAHQIIAPVVGGAQYPVVIVKAIQCRFEVGKRQIWQIAPDQGHPLKSLGKTIGQGPVHPRFQAARALRQKDRIGSAFAEGAEQVAQIFSGKRGIRGKKDKDWHVQLHQGLCQILEKEAIERLGKVLSRLAGQTGFDWPCCGAAAQQNQAGTCVYFQAAACGVCFHATAGEVVPVQLLPAPAVQP